jgi:hypothetical protein
MPTSRREFVAFGSLGLLAGVVPAQTPDAQNQTPTPGAPPAFGTAAPVGPEVSAATFKEAGKLVEVEMTAADLEQAAKNWRMQMAPLYERRVGPRKAELEATLAPALQWNPSLPGIVRGMPSADAFVRSADAHVPLPSDEAEIAYASVAQLSRWIERRELTSERLTQIYIGRIEKFDPKLRCVITLPREHALNQARKADAEIAAGQYRGPLHGIPWGAKDLLDTAGIATTYGAEPFRTACLRRMPSSSSVSRRRRGAGRQAEHGRSGAQRHLVWRPDHESVAARRRIVRLKRRARRGNGRGARRLRHRQRDRWQHCQPVDALWNHWTTADLRPRRPHGAMTLCWSLDKLGPMARYVEDTMLVLNTITGPDAGDLSSLPSTFDSMQTQVCRACASAISQPG